MADGRRTLGKTSSYINLFLHIHPPSSPHTPPHHFRHRLSNDVVSTFAPPRKFPAYGSKYNNIMCACACNTIYKTSAFPSEHNIYTLPISLLLETRAMASRRGVAKSYCCCCCTWCTLLPPREFCALLRQQQQQHTLYNPRGYI